MALNVRNVNQARISYSLGEPNDTQSSNTVIGLLKRIHSSSSLNGETINELIDEVDDLQETKADKSTTYTKTEVDNKLTLKADKSDTYTKTQVDNALLLKANSSDTYTKTQVYSKTEVDNALVLKANQSTTYTKTEVNTNLALKADKSDTYTKTQVDNLISAGTITNYVTTDTLQTITGTKMFTEAHATELYATNLRVNTHKFTNVAAVSGDSSSGNNTLCTKTYIDNQVINSQTSNSFKQTIMDLCYPIGSIYISWTNISLSHNYYGTAVSSGTPLDYGVWEILNCSTPGGACVLGLADPTETSGRARGAFTIELKHLPDHAHKGLYSYNAKKYSGSGSAAIPADTPDHSDVNLRNNDFVATFMTIGTSNNKGFTARGTQQPFVPYGYYVFIYRKTSLTSSN